MSDRRHLEQHHPPPDDEAITADLTGASAEAIAAYSAVVDAVLTFQTCDQALAECLERCRDFAVGQAYAAFTATMVGADDRAHHRADLARRARGTNRRERQLVEILLLAVDGDGNRAAALATEHVREFPVDADALSIVQRWSQDHFIDDRPDVAS